MSTSMKFAVCLVLVAVLPYLSNYVLSPDWPTCQPTQSLIVITGISTGLGLDVAVHLAQNGFSVLGTVRKVTDAERVKQIADTSGASGRLHTAICDVTQPADVAKLRLAIEDLLSADDQLRLAGLVNNAGVSARNTFEDWTTGKTFMDAEWMFRVNVLAVINVTGTLLPLLNAAAADCGSSRIVNVGSLAAYVTQHYSAVYGGTKGAIEQVSDGMRRQFRANKIFTSVIEPGFVQSGMCTRRECAANTAADSTTPAITHAITSRNPLARYPVAGATVMGFKLPAWVVVSLVSHLPDTLVDALIRALRK